MPVQAPGPPKLKMTLERVSEGGLRLGPNSEGPGSEVGGEGDLDSDNLSSGSKARPAPRRAWRRPPSVGPAPPGGPQHELRLVFGVGASHGGNLSSESRRSLGLAPGLAPADSEPGPEGFRSWQPQPEPPSPVVAVMVLLLVD